MGQRKAAAHLGGRLLLLCARRQQDRWRWRPCWCCWCWCCCCCCCCCLVLIDDVRVVVLLQICDLQGQHVYSATCLNEPRAMCSLTCNYEGKLNGNNTRCVFTAAHAVSSPECEACCAPAAAQPGGRGSGWQVASSAAAGGVAHPERQHAWRVSPPAPHPAKYGQVGAPVRMLSAEQGRRHLPA
jgi:hypothetical protein